MLSRAFEWYRIVNVLPSSQTIDNRKAAADDIISALDEASSWDLALSCAAGVAAGFEENYTQESPIVQLVVGKIQAHESAFPQDLTENALELRACAAVALGEILDREGDKAPNDAVLIASVLRTALYSRPAPKAKHLKQLLEELDARASRVLTAAGNLRRQPLKTAIGLLEQVKEPTDPATSLTAWKSLIPALKAFMKEATEQSAVDREELNTLWWMFAGASTTTGQLIAEMPAGAAALCCGVELGERCLLPPTASLESMVRRSYETGRKSNGKTDRSIEDVAKEWDGQFPSLLASSEKVRRASLTYPVLFPLSWLCNRLLESKGASGWASEFQRMTQIPTDYVRSPSDWTIQVFRECVAHRVYAHSLSAEG